MTIPGCGSFFSKVRWRSALFAVAFLAAPTPSLAAAWDHVYFPTALPENYPPGPWARTGFVGPGSSVSLAAGKLCLDFTGELSFVSWFRDSSMDPALDSVEMTVEWSQDVADAGFWALQVRGGDLSYTEQVQADGTVFRALIFNGVSVDLPGRGQHVWRIVKRTVTSELWRDGARIVTRGSRPVAAGSVALLIIGARTIIPFRGCTSYVSYAAGAFTPSELPSPAQGGGPSLEIRLSPDSVPPSKLDGVTLSNSAVIIHATDSQGNPAPNLEVTLSTEAVLISGGHDGPDHPGNRPAGFFTGGVCTGQSPCTCDQSNGDCVVAGPAGPQPPIYNAGKVGGKETIIAQLASAPSVSTSAILTVAVAPLQDFPALSNLFPFTQWKLTGQKTNFCGGSELSIHPSNHWIVPKIQNKMILAIQNFFIEQGGIQVGINDLSLQNGGIFDLCGKWKKPHTCHRTGASVDIDFLVGSAEADSFSQYMARAGARRVVEPKSLHYQFDSVESLNKTCEGIKIKRG